MLIEQVQKIIKEIEDGTQKILEKAGNIKPSANFTKAQSKALTDFRSGLRGLMGINLGELKNAFGIGIMQEMEKNQSSTNEHENEV